MRALIVSMVAGAGLLVSACGGETTVNTTNTVEDTTVVTENAADVETMTGPVDAANATGNTVVENTTTTTETTTNTTM